MVAVAQLGEPEPQEKGTIRELERANKRTLRAWQLKEELRDIMSMPLIAARRALDDWFSYTSRSGSKRS
jgi:hypothetical protein